ncbi:uncharacterized protein LOC129947614 [Eupeodes corollae]|uniref:uncharacterized protein LOC129947614 n=1 Tax=Eupeodes corollae TaxID=290404 RepID=UPI0024931537|nr:uncharacterized protein LOC129947614 [Eupeodes corollae]
MSRTLVVLLLLSSLLALASASRNGSGARIRYDNHRVYQVTAKSLQQLDVLKNLDGTNDKLVFLDDVHAIGSPLSVIVAPEMMYEFLQMLEESEIDYKLIEENAQSKLESEEETSPSSRISEYNWERYHELDETYSWLESLVTKFPKQVQLVEAGESYEGRKIMGIKISYKEGNKAVFLEGGMHAREWIGPATVTYMTNQLLTSTDPDVRSIAENFDWFVIPHANPDGYVYTHTTDRVWRKTRKPYGKCYGADPNRNWDFHWNEVGSSNNPCSDTYAGPEAFSEIETKSLSEYITSVKDNLMLYISYHSYSQLLLFPYGHTSEHPSNYDDLKRIYDVAVDAISRRYGTKYTGGNIYDAIYPAAGASLDWAYGSLGVNLTYCYELRPSSTNLWYGFRLPANQIIPTAEETLDSLVAMVKEASISGLTVMSRTLVVLLLLWSILALASSSDDGSGLQIRYDNHRVYQVTAKSLKQLNVLKNLDGASDKLVFLDEVHAIGRPLSVIVAPEMMYEFLQMLDESEIDYKLIEENAQSKLESEEETSPSSRITEYNWERYHELDETYSWLESLVTKFPKQVKLVEAGDSYEGRKIMGVKISYKEGNKAVFLEAGMHAREWIGPATVTHMTNQLLTSTDPDVRFIAENFDWFVIPHANPDGYVYSHTRNRLWRKTRTPYGNCYGADPNRNWDFHWNEVGTSSNPCSGTYAGPEPFSEIETRSLSEYITSVKDNLMLYISYHSYSQLLLFPYGHTSEHPSNYDDLKRIYDVAVDAISRRYGTKYTGGNIYDAIYPAAGASLDWAYGSLGVNLTYCYELRPSSNNAWYGFRLPAKQIIPTAEETLDSLVAMVKEAASSG